MGASVSTCPWGSTDSKPYCDFQVDSRTTTDTRGALVDNKLATFKISAVKVIENKFIIQSSARASKNIWECLAFEEQGAATHPSRYNWGNAADWCGVGDWNGYGKQVALMNNKQAVFIFTFLRSVSSSTAATRVART